MGAHGHHWSAWRRYRLRADGAASDVHWRARAQKPVLADDQLPLTIDNRKCAGFHTEIMRADFTAIVFLDQSVTENIEPPALTGQRIIARTFPSSAIYSANMVVLTTLTCSSRALPFQHNEGQGSDPATNICVSRKGYVACPFRFKFRQLRIARKSCR